VNEIIVHDDAADYLLSAAFYPDTARELGAYVAVHEAVAWWPVARIELGAMQWQAVKHAQPHLSDGGRYTLDDSAIVVRVIEHPNLVATVGADGTRIEHGMDRETAKRWIRVNGGEWTCYG
jgi:hypothetical protein